MEASWSRLHSPGLLVHWLPSLFYLHIFWLCASLGLPGLAPALGSPLSSPVYRVPAPPEWLLDSSKSPPTQVSLQGPPIGHAQYTPAHGQASFTHLQRGVHFQTPIDLVPQTHPPS